MKRTPALILFAMAFVGCGPEASDFVGRFSVTALETIDNCGGKTPRDTTLQDVTLVEITERTDEIIAVKAGDCEFLATVTDKGVFEATDCSCSVAYDDPEITITFDAQGEIVNSQLSLTLSGTYTTTDDFGFKFDCNYRVEFAG